jgi:nucleoside-diphosphate-sugar epimerase
LLRSEDVTVKILITGGTGNLAQYLIEELEDQHELVLFDRVKPGEGRAKYVTSHPYVQGDLTVGTDVERAVAGCDAVMHLGSIIGPTDSGNWKWPPPPGKTEMPPEECMRVNTMGAYHVMREAVRAGVKVVVAVTSNCVLGHTMRISARPFGIRYLPIDEGHPRDPEDSYGLSKSFAEQIMEGWSHAYGIRAYALRPSGLIRPERQKEHAANPTPTEGWDGEVLNGYADIGDVAGALRLSLEASGDLPMFDAYYINAPDTWAPEESLELLRRFRPDLLDKVRGDLSGRRAFISNEKARKAFGYRPENSWTRFA